MKSLLLSLEAVFPIFVLMLLGYLLKVGKIVGQTVFDGMNKLIFWVFLPTLLFYNIYSTDAGNVFDLGLILFCVVGILLVFVLGYVAVMFLTKENARRGVMLQGMFRSNVAFLGVPLVGYVCGKEAVGTAALTVAVVVPLVNVLAVICLERFRHGKPKFSVILKGVLKNPLLIGCVAGLLCLWLDIRFPSVLETPIGEVADMATPLAMIVLGAGFSFGGIKGYKKEIFVTVFSKLILIPLVMVVAAILLGFRQKNLVCILCTFAKPVAVASYAMARQMDADTDLASAVVVVSSALCCFSLFVFVFCLDALHFI